MLDIVASYHSMRLQGKPMIQTQENGEKPHFGSDLGQLDPTSGCQRFFCKNLASLVTKYHCQLLSRTISEISNDPIWRKSSDGRRDGLTDRWPTVIS